MVDPLFEVLGFTVQALLVESGHLSVVDHVMPADNGMLHL